MRNLLMAAMVVSLLAAPSLGVINVKLTADDTVLVLGQTTTVRIWAQGTAAGIFSLVGNIVVSGMNFLDSNAGSFTWAPEFSPNSVFFPKPGTAGSNGAWSGFGSEQTNWGTPDSNFAKADYTQVASYTVTCVTMGDAVLTFVGATVSGYKPLEVDKTSTLGLITPVGITVVPEPATLSLLALGGLLIARCRRASHAA